MSLSGELKKIFDKKYWERQAILNLKPTKVRIEATNKCNLNCVSCYMRADKTGEVKYGYLKAEDFKNFLRKNKYIKEVELSDNGEIFLNPELVEIMKIAYENKVRLTAENGVNFNKVDDETLDALAKYKFKKIMIAIDGASQDSYVKYRRNGNFDKVIENIRKLNEYKKKYNSQYPELEWAYIVMSYNENEIPLAKKLANELGMRIYFKLNWDKSFYPIVNKEFVKQETGLEETSLDEVAEHSKILYKEMCYQMWHSPQIDWDGSFNGCCAVYKSNLGVNAFKSNLLKCIKSKNVKYAKNMLLGRVKAKPDITCTYCDIYKQMVKHNNFVKTPELIESIKKVYEQTPEAHFLKVNKFEKTLKTLKKKLKNKRVVIHGANFLFDAVLDIDDLRELNIIGISDFSFDNLAVEKYKGFTAILPSEIKQLSPDYLLICAKDSLELIEYFRYNLLSDTNIKVLPFVKRSFISTLKEIWR